MAAFVRWYVKRSGLKSAKGIELPKYDKNSQLYFYQLPQPPACDMAYCGEQLVVV